MGSAEGKWSAETLTTYRTDAFLLAGLTKERAP